MKESKVKWAKWRVCSRRFFQTRVPIADALQNARGRRDVHRHCQ